MKPGKLVLLIAAGSTLWVPATPLQACPPRPMIDLWAELEGADAVVVARVEKVRPTVRALLIGAPRLLAGTGSTLVESLWYDGALVLDELASGLPETPYDRAVTVSIEETLAGWTPSRFTVAIPQWPGYPPGTRILLFLRWSVGRLVPSQVGWGPVPVHPEDDLGDLRLAVAAGVELLRSGEPTPDEIVEWRVLASSLRGTRPWVLPWLARSEAVTARQAETLAATFTSEPVEDWMMQFWLAALAKYPDLEVDRHAAAAIETWRLEDSWPWEPGATHVLVRVGITPDEIPEYRCAPSELERLWLSVLDCALVSTERPCRPGG